MTSAEAPGRPRAFGVPRVRALAPGGLVVVALAPEAGIALLLAGFLGVGGTHLGVAVVHYRRTMRRPWPQVPPLDDNDDDW